MTDAPSEPDPSGSYEGMAAMAVLVFGDDPARRGRLAAIARAAGARVVGEESIAEAGARLDMQSAGHVLVDLVEDGGAALDALLDRLEATPAIGAIVVAVPALIDLVARRPRLLANMLVDPDPSEIEVVLRALAAPPPSVVQDSAPAAAGRRLQELREELGRIARTLTTLSVSIDAAAAGADAAGSAETRAAVARGEIRQRRMRGQFFDPALFADPAWDMLLDLAAAENERRRVAVSSLCIAAAVPPTTALRWIAQMTEAGLLVREPDPDDRRRVFVAMSEGARTAMDRYLDAAAGARG